MTTAWNGVASIRGSVTADGEFLTSPTRGIDMVRKASVPYAAQLMAINVARDAAEVALGPLAGVRITDADGNLVYHDEETTGGLDAIRLATLRRWANRSGVFLTNPLVISSPGSDFVLMQQVRTMNRACEVAYGQMVSEMSKGVFTNPATQTIREDSAQAIDEPVNAAIEEAIGSQVQDFAFAIDRSQVLSAPTAILEGVIELVMTVYIKGFRVTARLVRRITVRTP
jgi:hypothetical protein